MTALLTESANLAGRTLAIYLVTFFMVKLMGKRHVGQLSPLDFVVGVIIGSVAAAPMVDLELSLLPTIVPIIILGLLEVLASVLALNNPKIRLFLEDMPAVIIKDGQIIKENMAKVRMNIDDLKQELRKLGVADINEIKEGVLESCGFSIIKKKEYQPLTTRDLQTVTLHNLDRFLSYQRQKNREDLTAVVEELRQR